MIFTVTEANFKALVLDAKKPVVLDVWAPWCTPCKILEPIIEGVSKELEHQLDVGKLNADENSSLVQQLGVMGLPTMLLFQQGQATVVSVGVLSAEKLREVLAGLLKVEKI